MSSNCFEKVNSQLSIMKFCYEYTAWRLRQNSAKQTRSSEIAPRLLLSSVQLLSPLTNSPSPPHPSPSFPILAGGHWRDVAAKWPDRAGRHKQLTQGGKGL